MGAVSIIVIAGITLIQFLFDSDRKLFENAMSFAQQQVKSLIDKHPDFYPMYTENGVWNHEGPIFTHWCDGFLPGMMWLFLKHGGGSYHIRRHQPGFPADTVRSCR